MYEYLKIKQTDSPKHSVSHSVVQQRVISDRNSYADRFAKPEYYQIRDTSSVVQMCYEEDSEEPDDSNDSDYVESKPKKRRKSLNSTVARRKLGEKGNGGEAHHIIPRNVVEELDFVTPDNIERFNEQWNIIMLHGTIDKNYDVQNEYTGNKGAPDILHRVNNERSHTYYDEIVRQKIAERNPKNIDDCKLIAEELRKLIENSGEFALDFM